MKKLLNEHFIIMVFFSTMLFLVVAGLFFLHIPEDNINLINIALGFIAGYVSAQNSYFFGDTDRHHKEKLNEEIDHRTDETDSQ